MNQREREIRERAEKATKGPWGWTYDGSSTYTIGEDADPQCLPLTDVYERWRGFEETTANCDFIAHAREDIPYLLAQLTALQDAVKEWKESQDIHFEMRRRGVDYTDGQVRDYRLEAAERRLRALVDPPQQKEAP